MQFSSLLLAATGLLLSLPSLSAAGPHADFQRHPRDIKCTGSPLVRKEWRMLTVEQRRKFISTLRKLYEHTDEVSFVDKISRLHVQMNNYIHGSAAFFPWHRWVLRYVELKLQEVSGDPQLTIPYWSTTFDSQGPEMAPVFGDEDHHFGRSGNPRNKYCVETGGFKGITLAYSDKKQPDAVFVPHCLRRDFRDGDKDNGRDLAAFVAAEALMSDITRSRSYRELRAFVESAPHGLPHMLISADFGTMVSPNDPLFWLHHADIDRMWYVWQNLKDKPRRLLDYEDTQKMPGKTSDRVVDSKLEQPLPSFEHIQVADVMDSEKLCIVYEELDVSRIQPPRRKGIRSVQFHRRDETAAKAPASTPAAATDSAAPVEVKVEQQVKEEAGPKPNDRTDLTSLRQPPALSTEWIEMNHLNVSAVRTQETNTNKLIVSLNKIPGFVSISAFWNQPNKLAKLPSWNDLKVKLGNARVAVAAPESVANFNLTKSIESLKQKVRAAFKTEHVVQNDKPEVQQQVQQAAGGKLDITGWFKGLKQQLGYSNVAAAGHKAVDSIKHGLDDLKGKFNQATDSLKNKLGFGAKTDAPAPASQDAATAPSTPAK